MLPPPPIRRVILVVLDGLRADAAARHGLIHLPALARCGRWSLSGRTVQPSITAAAMTSVMTGADPAVHGLRDDRFRIPRLNLPVLPGLLRDRGLPTFGYMAKVPMAYWPVATAIARHLGCKARFEGDGAAEIVEAARADLLAEPAGLFFLHWPDADRAGHAHGWHSPEYADAARRLDRALGILATITRVIDDPSTLLMAFADHGGGGLNARDHESEHPEDTTIPVVMAGGAVHPGQLDRPVSLLDIPATALWALGIDRPATFSGRPVTEAFQPVAAPALPEVSAPAAQAA